MTPPFSDASAETYHRRRRAIFAAAAAAIYALVRLRPFRVEVRGDSMRPTLEPGDWCVATAGGHVKKGDVVVVDRGEREVVKRVTGVPGEEGLGFDEWFVQGDNPDASSDSRRFGPVPRTAIRGRVRFVYSPPARRALL